MGAVSGADQSWAAGPELALDFADRAGRMVREVVAAGFEVSVKADMSPVTTADRVLNDRFIDEVREQFPGDGVLGEETSFPGDREDGRC
ncbi:hypothetical protein GCM10022223_13940 [Kineosporia mesophila]|uniref:Inositol monophosphatase n=1 Tax=Kineosporia mesophila TaxID=566012 RepID=A0ABP6Z7G6_9ACTN